LKFTLAPEFWFRHEHVDYEQLVGVADDSLDVPEREIIDIHLMVCASCKEDIRSFLAFREQIAPEMEVTYSPFEREPTCQPYWVSWWRGLAWKPAYAFAAVILIAVALAIAVVVFKNRSRVFEAWKSPTPQTSPKPTPSGDQAETAASPATNVPTNESASKSPKPTIEPSPKRTIENPAPQIGNSAVVALNDGRSTITFNKDGNVTGLDDVPPQTKRDIATALVAEKIEPPSVLNSLAPESTTLRGDGSKGAPFRLLSPGRVVIIESSPVFSWEQLSGASAYRVYVLDSRGHQVAKSEDLPPAITEWKPSTSLKRGNIYSWVVIAVVDGKEIVSPGAAAPAMKFQVLSASALQNLNQLKRTRSHVVLGVFYAKVGLLSEAEGEFQELVRLNPDDKVAKKLLRSVRFIHSTTR